MRVPFTNRPANNHIRELCVAVEAIELTDFGGDFQRPSARSAFRNLEGITLVVGFVFKNLALVVAPRDNNFDGLYIELDAKNKSNR